MRAKVQLDIAELEKNILIAKQKADSDHYLSQARQNKIKEEILELGLKTSKKEIWNCYLVELLETKINFDSVCFKFLYNF